MLERCLMTFASGWLLLAAGPALADCEGWDATVLARMTVEELAACLEAGADPKARDGSRQDSPPLWRPLNNENPAVVTALLEAGADPKARDKVVGTTPLHLAAGGNENPAVIAVLLEAGADLKARDKVGMIPLHWAAFNNENPAVIVGPPGGGCGPEGASQRRHDPSRLGGHE